MIQAQDRVQPLEGIHNFRDYGGYAARGGNLRQGMLWRSGQHCEATAEDLEKVNALGIATVIDLRGDSERALYPCLRHEQFSGNVLFHPGETGDSGRAAHEEAAMGVTTAAQAHDAMVFVYALLPFRRVLAGTMRLYLEALAERDGATLLHCLAGKDRTGIAAALVHSLLGVHHDDLMADYLLTNTVGNAEKRIAAGAEHVRAVFGKDMDDDALRVLMGVSPEFLDTALAAMRERHGSVQSYAENVLGLTPAQLLRIEQRLIA